MHIYRLHACQILPIDIDRAWSFFSDPRNLQQITPDDLNFAIHTSVPDLIHAGLFIGYRLQVAPGVAVSWWTEIKHVNAPYRFVDEQRSGPYRLWYHEHRLTAVDCGVEVEDIVHYALPYGWLGRLIHALYIRRRLEQIFTFRRQTLEGLFPSIDRNLAANLV